MNSGPLLIGMLFIPPLLGVAASALPLRSRGTLIAGICSTFLECVAVAALYRLVPHGGVIFALHGNLFIDTLSLYHIALVAGIFLLSSIYSLSYFSEEIARGAFTAARARRFGIIWNCFFGILIVVLCSNNMGLLWISLEATTLISALLILTDGRPASIEATWKYLLLCSVGIAFAFVGTLLVSVASHNAQFPPHESLLWTALSSRATMLDGKIMLAAFIFILVGFGTKAGLAPMHTWLPDAHSQAPTPVSAVFSGIMLNCALYCIMRYLPLCEGALGHSGRPHALLVFFGLISILIAAVFIPAQKNIKRLLAYCSVEHMGIIALGLGIGGLGTFAALFHVLNHSVSKTLAFFSAGRLARQYGTYDMGTIKGAIAMNPLWGAAFFVSVLALIGAAPFSVFMSEFQIVKALIDAHRYAAIAVFLFGAIVVFISVLRNAIDVSTGAALIRPPAPTWFGRDYLLVGVCCALLLLAGLAMPSWYADLLNHASAIVEGTARGATFGGGLFK
jgi:hydrogenase-4 component F